MCEILVVSSAAPVTFATVAEHARVMEHYGQANFGWGVAFLDGDRVRCHRSTGKLREDPVAEDWLAEVKSTRFLVHFRRPSKLSTIQLADTQPFVDDAGAFAFAHNGRFVDEPAFRPRYESRLAGAADSEVGFVMFEDLVAAGTEPAEALRILHDQLGGRANLAALDAAGGIALYSSYEGNRMWTFRDGDLSVAATELHSADESLFDLVFPEAVDRRVVEGASQL